MLFFLIASIFFLVLLFKSLLLQPLPSWAIEMRLLSLLFYKESLIILLQWLRNSKTVATAAFLTNSSTMSTKKKIAPKSVELDESDEEKSVLDLPDLALECILSRLPPTGLCNMAGVCRSMRDMCRSDHMWETHMNEKWSRIISPAMHREWQRYVASMNGSSGSSRGKFTGFIGSLPCIWPISWLRSKFECGRKLSSFPGDSIMAWYLSLEGGKFWFPAQVYNRENGHMGFMLSCYDAEISYNRNTDTFHARYPPHGRRTVVVEEGVQWDRVRAPPVDTSALDLHVSDCLADLRPGEHVEIQWRRNKEFPYGWWYGVIGHLETCDGTELHCRCHRSDTVILEFNQYATGSRWRRTAINRKDHREEGNETDGFYGGIRRLQRKEEISMWRKLWPTDILE